MKKKEIIKNIPRADLRPVDYGDRKNNPVKIQYYDDQEISTTVINVTENIDLNDYRVRNRQIVEPVFNKSKYYYDSLNRWVKLEQYLKEGELSQGRLRLSLPGLSMISWVIGWKRSTPEGIEPELSMIY